MKPAFTKAWAVIDRIIEGMNMFAGVLLSFAVVSISVSIATRYFLNKPIGWIAEVAGYLLLFMTFLVAAWVLKGEGHVVIDIVLERLPVRTQQMLNAVTSIVSAIVCFILTWFGARVTWHLYTINYRTPTDLSVQKTILICIVFVGSLFLALQFLKRAYEYIMLWRRPKVEGKHAREIRDAAF